MVCLLTELNEPWLLLNKKSLKTLCYELKKKQKKKQQTNANIASINYKVTNKIFTGKQEKADEFY